MLRLPCRVPLASSLLLSWVILPVLGRGLEAQTSLAGRWRLDAVRFGEKKLYFVEIRQEGKKISGTWISPRTGSYAVEGGTFENGRLTFEVRRERGDLEPRVYAIEAELEGGRLVGELKVNGQAAGPVTLTRAAHAAAGRWKVVARNPDGSEEYPSTLEVRDEGGRLRARSVSELGTIEVQEIETDGERLVFHIVLPIDDREVPFMVRAEFEGPERLVGRWVVREREDVSGEWTAEREAPEEAILKAVEQPAARPSPAAVFAGRWYGMARTPDGLDRWFKLELRVDGERLSGVVAHAEGTSEVEEARLAGEGLRFVVRTDEGPILVEGRIREEGVYEVFAGTLTVPDGTTGDFTARKPVTL